jgi:hypothetical protein
VEQTETEGSGGGRDGGTHMRLGWGKALEPRECGCAVPLLQNATAVAAPAGPAIVRPHLHFADARWDAAAARLAPGGQAGRQSWAHEAGEPKTIY